VSTTCDVVLLHDIVLRRLKGQSNIDRNVHTHTHTRTHAHRHRHRHTHTHTHTHTHGTHPERQSKCTSFSSERLSKPLGVVGWQNSPRPRPSRWPFTVCVPKQLFEMLTAVWEDFAARFGLVLVLKLTNDAVGAHVKRKHESFHQHGFHLLKVERCVERNSTARRHFKVWDHNSDAVDCCEVREVPGNKTRVPEIDDKCARECRW
jgi:hypothetical protein